MSRRNLFSSVGTIVILMVAALPAQSEPGNLLLNGDFELGDTGFSSDYTYSPAANTTESQYTIRTNPSPWNASFVSASRALMGLRSSASNAANDADDVALAATRTCPVSPRNGRRMRP